MSQQRCTAPPASAAAWAAAHRAQHFHAFLPHCWMAGLAAKRNSPLAQPTCAFHNVCLLPLPTAHPALPPTPAASETAALQQDIGAAAEKLQEAAPAAPAVEEAAKEAAPAAPAEEAAPAPTAEAAAQEKPAEPAEPAAPAAPAQSAKQPSKQASRSGSKKKKGKGGRK